MKSAGCQLELDDDNLQTCSESGSDSEDQPGQLTPFKFDFKFRMFKIVTVTRANLKANPSPAKRKPFAIRTRGKTRDVRDMPWGCPQFA